MARNIYIKYDVGDNIRFIYSKQEDIFITCPCCNGLGNIIGYNGDEYECPECEGRKKIKTGHVRIIEEEREGTIASVHVHYDSNLYAGRGKGSVNIYYQIPQSNHHIYQDNIIEKIVSE